MRQAFYWKMIVASLLRRMSRMMVALLAVAIGSTILSGLLTIYLDVPRQMGKEFRKYGANFIVLPKDNERKILFEDLELIRKIVPESALVGMAPYRYYQAKINEQPFMIAATDLREAEKNNPYWLVEGSWPQQEGQVLLGRKVAESIGLSIGDSFQITAVKDEALTKDHAAQDKRASENQLSQIDIDKNTVKRDYVLAGTVTTGGAEESLIWMGFKDLERLRAEAAAQIDVVECSIDGNQRELESYVQALKERSDQLVPRLAQRLTASQDSVLSKLKALIFLVTFIVLVLTMISVSTTMMAVVVERKTEIGLKKALGASHRSVMWDFLGEGMVLGALGGLLGAFLGYWFAREVGVSVFARAIEVNIWIFPATVCMALVMTVLASLIPVRRTIEVEPAIVLKGE